MANYYASSRTSYAKIKDEELFFAWTRSIPEAEVIIREDKEHGKLYGLLFESDPGSIPTMRPDVDWRAEGLPDDTGDAPDDCSLDRDWVDFDIYEEIQHHLVEGWAITFVEAGAEKLRYICGYAALVTPDEVRFTSLDRWVTETLGELGSPKHTDAMY
jgi:hypothetical protein